MFVPGARTSDILAQKTEDIANRRTSSTSNTPIGTFLNRCQTRYNKMEGTPKIYPSSSAMSVIQLAVRMCTRPFGVYSTCFGMNPQSLIIPWASTASYYDSFAFVCIDDVHASQKSHAWAYTVCYGDSFTFYMQIMFVPHRKHIYEPPRPLKGIALLFIYIDDVPTSHETPICH
jgi:hypothetical protein